MNKNMKSYEQWRNENTEKRLEEGKCKFSSNILKAEMFKLEVIKLMLEYNLSISHEDEHGAFKIIPYKENFAEWFMEAEYYK